jgi:hypothetical protein
MMTPGSSQTSSRNSGHSARVLRIRRVFLFYTDNTMRRRLTLVLAPLLGVGLMVPAGAASSYSISRLSLPTGVVSVASGLFPYLGCPSATSCVGVGLGADDRGAVVGISAFLQNGTWTSDYLPPGPNSIYNDATPYGISCSGVDMCLVAGTYVDPASATGNQIPYVAVMDTAQTTPTISLPSTYSHKNTTGSLHAISCVRGSTVWCVAVGSFIDNKADTKNVGVGRTMGFGVLLKPDRTGVVGATTSSAFTLPANATYNPSVSLTQVSCSSVGNCTAIGQYSTTRGTTSGFAISMVSGTWGSPTAFALPSNAQWATSSTVNELSCASAGNCTALGTYTTTSGNQLPFAVSSASGQWQSAQTLTLPSGASLRSKTMFYGFQSLSCPSTSSCAAGGQYRDASGRYQGFLVNRVNSVWTTATTLSLPTGAQYAGRNGGVVAVECASAGNCLAGSAYVDSGGHYQTGIVSQSAGGAWSTLSPFTLPSGATELNVGGGLYAVSCASGTCHLIGTYWSGTNYQAFVGGNG